MSDKPRRQHPEPDLEIGDEDDEELQEVLRSVIQKATQTTKEDAAALNFVMLAHPEGGGLQGDLIFQARQLVQTSLPHRRPPNDEVYVRRNGNASLVVQSGTDRQGNKIGIPYGAVCRLLFAFLTREAVRKRNRVISLGDTFGAFCRSLGMDANNGETAKRVTDQLRRMLSCSITFISTTQLADGQGYEERLNLPVATYAKLWFRYQRGTHENASLFGPSVVVLNVDFFDAIVQNPIPLDLDVLLLLKKSPLAIDIYSWGKYRTFKAKERAHISWYQLAGQFGAEYKTVSDFKKNFVVALKKVQAACPELKIKKVKGGLEITPSRERRRVAIPSGVPRG